MLSTSILYCNNIEQETSKTPHQPQAPPSETSSSITIPQSTFIRYHDRNHHHRHRKQRNHRHHQHPHQNHYLSQNNCQRYLQIPPTKRSSIDDTRSSISDSCGGLSRSSKNSIISSSSAYSMNKFKNTDHNNGSRYRVQYLGCNSCDIRTHKPDNGIVSYQKPLLDLYCAIFRRSLMNRTLLHLNQVADLSTHGIFIAEKDRFAASSTNTNSNNDDDKTIHLLGLPGSSASNNNCHNSENNFNVNNNNNDITSNRSDRASQTTSIRQSSTIITKVITPLNNIILWAAVRFQHRTTNKLRNNNSDNNKTKINIKRKHSIGVAFVPLSCSEAVLDKNAFIALNSKQQFLLGIPHPPLFVCILQKINSNQRLECHMFVCGSANDAIRMCNRMNELRQCSLSIGSLKIPISGEMGKYSYNNPRHHNLRMRLSSSNASTKSSTTSSIMSRSYTPSQISKSDLSTIISTSISRPQFSDIEEEEDLEQDDLIVDQQNINMHREMDVKNLINNYQSKISMNINNNDNNNNSKQIGIKHHHHHQHQHVNTKQHPTTLTTAAISTNHDIIDHKQHQQTSNCVHNPRLLYKQTSTKMINNKVASINADHYDDDGGDNNNRNGWPSKLSSSFDHHSSSGDGGAAAGGNSIVNNVTKSTSNNFNNNNHRKIKKQIDTNGEQYNNCVGRIAQRDYRFKSYRTSHPSSRSSSVSSSVTISPSSSTLSIIIDDDVDSIINNTNNHHIKNINQKLLSRPKSEHNLIYLNADHRNESHSTNNNKMTNKWRTTNDLASTTSPSTNELLKNRLFAKQALISNSSDDKDKNDGNDRIKNEKFHTFFGDSLKKQPNSHQEQTDKKKFNKEQSIISNSIFLDDEDYDKDDENTMHTNSNNDKIRKNSEILGENLIQNNTNNNMDNNNLSTKYSKLINNNNIEEQSSLLSSSMKQQQNNDDNKKLASSRLCYEKDFNCSSNSNNNNRPLKLYLPSEQEQQQNNCNDNNIKNNGANLGVKGFNKSSRVEQWSTMVAATSSSTSMASPLPSSSPSTTAIPPTKIVDSCNLCQMELENCDKCCRFCQTIEEHKYKYLNNNNIKIEDDIDFIYNNVNDDIILDDMTMKNFSTNVNNGNNNSSQMIVKHNKHRMAESLPQKLPLDPLQQQESSDLTFFNRIRRFNWHSIFSSSRSKKSNGSRLWNRLRTGSQRLRGSRRYFQNKNRLFSPQTCDILSTNLINDHRQRYDKPLQESKPKPMNGHKVPDNCYNYDEHYLKPPSLINADRILRQKIMTNDKMINATDFDGDSNANAKNFKAIDDKHRMLNISREMENLRIDNISTKRYANESNSNNNALDINHDGHPSDFIRPFFISHPSRQLQSNSNGKISNNRHHHNHNDHLDNKIINLGLNGISISSDSGMEEYDYHSSAEHSPSGYYINNNNNHNHNKPNNKNICK